MKKKLYIVAIVLLAINTILFFIDSKHDEKIRAEKFFSKFKTIEKIGSDSLSTTEGIFTVIDNEFLKKVYGIKG